jgi:hypothetical protein
MRTGAGAVALTAAAVLAALGPGAASSAAATWTVRPGGAVTATAGETILKDKNGDDVKCASSRMSSTLKAGGGLPGTGIGSITAAAYKCPMIFGSSYQLTPLGLPWRLNLTSYDAGTGVSRGTITHVRIAFSVVTCSAVIAGASATSGGQVAVSYANQTGALKILSAGGTLHWYRVHNCAHVVADGDPVALSASYAVSPPQTITSP